ncbi:Galactokinase [Fusarium oxysporum f. sp. albedinis]|nr:Galactokinase [Fusarium oxysporum f. sp. albedinis]
MSGTRGIAESVRFWIVAELDPIWLLGLTGATLPHQISFHQLLQQFSPINFSDQDRSPGGSTAFLYCFLSIACLPFASLNIPSPKTRILKQTKLGKRGSHPLRLGLPRHLLTLGSKLFAHLTALFLAISLSVSINSCLRGLL